MQVMRRFAGLLMMTAFLVSASVAQQRSYTMKVIGSHDDEVLGVFVNGDNTKVATCSLDETVKVWSLPDGKELLTLKGHFEQVNNVAFSSDDQLIASASSDGMVKVWNANTGELQQTMRGHTAEVLGVYFGQGPSAGTLA